MAQENEPWKFDAAAFAPDPAGYIEVDNERYPIYSFLDVPVRDSIEVIRLADSLHEQDYDTRMESSIRLLMILNRGPEQGREQRPLLEEERLRRLAPRQIVVLTVMATSVALPLKADAGALNPQASSSPASAGSTDGHTENSSA